MRSSHDLWRAHTHSLKGTLLLISVIMVIVDYSFKFTPKRFTFLESMKK